MCDAGIEFAHPGAVGRTVGRVRAMPGRQVSVNGA
jgi:hypothetical protein